MSSDDNPDRNRNQKPTTEEVAHTLINEVFTPRHKEIAHDQVARWEAWRREQLQQREEAQAQAQQQQQVQQPDPVAESINELFYRVQRLETLLDPDKVDQPTQFKATSRKARRFSIGGGFSRLVNRVSKQKES